MSKVFFHEVVWNGSEREKAQIRRLIQTSRLIQEAAVGHGEGLDEIEFHEKIWGLNPRSFGVKMATLLILTWSIANSGNSGYGRAGGSVVKRERCGGTQLGCLDISPIHAFPSYPRTQVLLQVCLTHPPESTAHPAVYHVKCSAQNPVWSCSFIPGESDYSWVWGPGPSILQDMQKAGEKRTYMNQ